MKKARRRQNRRAEVADTRISPRNEAKYLLCRVCHPVRKWSPWYSEKLNKADIRKRFRQRDRDHKVKFLTQHIPADLPEVIDIDLSVLEEPMEKYA
jgi:hypothetical protein